MNENIRPGWLIKTSGCLFEDVKDWEAEAASLSTELSETEKKSAYTKYYYRQIAMPSHENLKAAEFNNPLPKELAIRPEEYVSRMDSPAINDMRSGYYVFEDGIGFSIARVVLKGVNDEKFDYFNKNFNPEENLFYKCWYPGMHLKHYTRGAVEDVGNGMEIIYFLAGYSLSQLAGVENYKPKDPYFVEFHGGSGVSWPMHNMYTNERYALQANLTRDLPNGEGREMIICFWFGMKWEDGKPVRALPEGEKTDIQIVRAQFNHSVWEYTQVGYLVNQFWADNH